MSPVTIILSIADSQPMFLEAMAILLEHTGSFKVSIKAYLGADLINELDKATVLPDILILDTTLCFDGFDVHETVKKRWPQIKTLLLAPYDFEEQVVRFIQQGANGFLLKSNDTGTLIRAITDIHHAGYYYSQQITAPFVKVIRNSILKYAKFTAKELEVLKHSGEDLTYEQVADVMHTSKRAVEGIRDSLFKKTGIHTRQGLVIFAIKYGVIKLSGLTTGGHSRPLFSHLS